MELDLFPRRRHWPMDLFDWPERLLSRRWRDPFEDWLEPNYLPMVRPQFNRILSDGTTVRNDKDGFRVKLDVSNFKPDEITVKAIDNNLVIHGKHEEKSDDYGFVSREFTRRYLLPAECEMDNITTRLNDKGVLNIDAPKKRLLSGDGNERTIPIQMGKKHEAIDSK